MAPLDCERNGAFTYRCRQGHEICISHRAARFGLDPNVVAKACDDTEPRTHASVTHMQPRRATKTVKTDSDGFITRATR